MGGQLHDVPWLKGPLRIHNALFDFIHISATVADDPNDGVKNLRDWQRDWFKRFLKINGNHFPYCYVQLMETAADYGLKSEMVSTIAKEFHRSMRAFEAWIKLQITPRSREAYESALKQAKSKPPDWRNMTVKFELQANLEPQNFEYDQNSLFLINATDFEMVIRLPDTLNQNGAAYELVLMSEVVNVLPSLNRYRFVVPKSDPPPPTDPNLPTLPYLKIQLKGVLTNQLRAFFQLLQLYYGDPDDNDQPVWTRDSDDIPRAIYQGLWNNANGTPADKVNFFNGIIRVAQALRPSEAGFPIRDHAVIFICRTLNIIGIQDVLEHYRQGATLPYQILEGIREKERADPPGEVAAISRNRISRL